MPSSTTSLRRFSIASITTLALAAALVGCGDSDDKGDAAASPTTPPVKVLSEPETTSALITEDNLGGQFPVAEDTDDEESDAPGCINDIADVLGDESPAKATSERDFEASDDQKSATVGNKVFSYESVEAAENAIKEIRDGLEGCDEVDETIDGNAVALEVESDDDESESDVDDQVNLVASGTITTSGGAIEVAFYLSVVRVENNITAVVASTLNTELPGPVTDLVEVANDRLQAVMDGKTPDEDVIAGQ